MVVQEKILRAVEYGSFERVGSSTPIHVDVRIVAAANADLRCHGPGPEQFKQDLLDRLSFEVIYVPPLRHRKEDVTAVCPAILPRRMAFELGRQEIPTISPSAVKALESYSWPGNIRELKNVIERAVYKSKSDKISNVSFNPFNSPYSKEFEKINLQSRRPGDLTTTDAHPNSSMKNDTNLSAADETARSLYTLPLKEAVSQLEVQMVKNAITTNQFNQKNAARSLGLSYDQLRGLIKKHGKKALGI
jgi:psp operon transcriptional activator